MGKFFVLLTAAATWSVASAQDYPSRPINVIVPLAAGGTTDTVARIVTQHMRPSLSQPLIIENVTGAGGSLGVARAARAAPDGYSLIIGNWRVMLAAVLSTRS